MKVLIVDDELYARNHLRDLIKKHTRYEISGYASDGAEAIEEALKKHPNLILLDICMPGMDGLEVAKALERMPCAPRIIFTTAHSEYALKAFNTAAFGFLLKPVTSHCLLKRIEYVNQMRVPVISEPPAGKGCQYITCRTGEKIEIINTKDIMFVRSESKYVIITHTGGENILIKTLLQVEEKFGNQFIRIHRSILVNTDYIKSLEKINKNKSILRLRGHSKSLPVSRKHVSGVRQFFTSIDALSMRHAVRKIQDAGVPGYSATQEGKDDACWEALRSR